jgi:hypothetical protein
MLQKIKEAESMQAKEVAEKVIILISIILF